LPSSLPLIHRSAWNRNSRKFISKILHNPAPSTLISCLLPLIAPPLPGREIATRWMFMQDSASCGRLHHSRPSRSAARPPGSGRGYPSGDPPSSLLFVSSTESFVSSRSVIGFGKCATPLVLPSSSGIVSALPPPIVCSMRMACSVVCRSSSALFLTSL
jgi:hypothetical protein